jgi:hypothetical protein
MKILNKLEKILIVCVLVGLGAVLAVQYIIVFDTAELFFKIGEHLEQQPVTFYEEFPEARVTASDTYQSIFATITIQCENYSSLEKAVLLINGKEVGDFRDKKITVKVSSGDVLAIDGSFYVHELIFKVAATSENVAQPEIGQVIRVCGDIGMLGEVRLK